MTFMQVDIRYQMALSPVSLPREIDLNFQGQQFKILISHKRVELAQNAPYDFYAG